MSCYYCDKIQATDPDHAARPASHDLGSQAPRCSFHWRYLCGSCGAPAHFMSSSYCRGSGRFFCSDCATGSDEVIDGFWAWKYYFSYGCPWSDGSHPALDRMEFEGRHPLQTDEPGAAAAVSEEAYLVRYPERWQPPPEREHTDQDVRASWNANADRWSAGYDDDGDRNRKYQSDEPMLGLLGDVRGQRVLDVGSGNGYLSRKLARAGAAMTGVELSDRFLAIAKEREERERLGITYHEGSVAQMDFLPDTSFDKAVSNYVLMEVLDYQSALREVFRALRPGGLFVAVISHPSFMVGPAGWLAPAPDSPRIEDRTGWRTDRYFHREPTILQWGDLDPVLGFHRPLRDYWEAFVEAGFAVDAFEEPSITERGRRELPVARVEQSLRIPYSCMFRLVKPGPPA